MQRLEQADYFLRRAEEERAAAANASDERAARSHRSLAARYDAKAKGGPVRELKPNDPDSGSSLPKEFRILP
jgi:hypothetical protein